MASSVYRSARATPRGTTTSTALHARHRYRRATTVVDPGAAPGSAGPSTSRLRSPCPTTVNERPGSRLAAPQTGQLAGRTAEHDGGAASQNLTSIADWMIRTSLRSIACNRLQRSAAGQRCANTARHLLSEPRARASSPARATTTTAASPARNVQAPRRGRPRSAPDPPQAACARSGVDPSTTLRGNTERDQKNADYAEFVARLDAAFVDVSGTRPAPARAPASRGDDGLSRAIVARLAGVAEPARSHEEPARADAEHAAYEDRLASAFVPAEGHTDSRTVGFMNPLDSVPAARTDMIPIGIGMPIGAYREDMGKGNGHAR